jgi:hypothetical protein
MLSKSAKELGKENGWYYDRSLYGSVFGLYNNYFFEVKEGEGNKILTATFDEIDEKIGMRLTQALKENKNRLKIGEFGIDSQGLGLIFVERFRNTKKEVLYAALDFLVELFEDNQIPHQNKCFDCGSQKELDYYIFDGVPGMLCPNCYDVLRQQWGFVEKDFDSEDKNYILGTVGAIIYTIPGIIIWIIVALFLKALSGVLVLGIGFLAFKGFMNFGGRAGPWSKWIIVAVTLVATVVSIFATVFVGMYFNGYGYQEIFNEIMINEEVQEFIKRTLFVSAIIGIIPLAYLFYEIYSASKLPKLKIASKIT